jgi:bifunctional DNA-binding transcriptional regulator/antitoxin component of YhaV-PrlF toxin-antitoxin module
MKVLFDTKKVQKLGRISFTEQLLRNAGLQEGDPVNIYFDASSKCIILERADKVGHGAVDNAKVATGTRRKHE